jgi:hypothetical protein
VPKDPIRRDDAKIERVRKKWRHTPEDEILELLGLLSDQLDEEEERDKHGRQS